MRAIFLENLFIFFFYFNFIDTNYTAAIISVFSSTSTVGPFFGSFDGWQFEVETCLRQSAVLLRVALLL